jgi:Zn-finger nucleic acid-binding protein
MTRRRAIVKMRPDNPMAFDACRRCGSIWLADGELVRLRIDFAAAAKAIDDLNVKTRIERLSLEEQERLDKQIAELPLPKGFLGGVLSDLVHDPRLLVGLLAAAAIVSLLVCLYFAVQQ